MRRIVLFVALMLVTGCVTTAQELINTSQYKKTIKLDQNYQAAYRDILTVLRNCYAGPINLVVSTKVEGQLYSDLKFGEISWFQDNLAAIHHAYVKIAKAGDGSEVTIYAAGIGYLKPVEEHVRGSKEC
jgi:hypothetical protein